jgi:hypothetical protein
VSVEELRNDTDAQPVAAPMGAVNGRQISQPVSGSVMTRTLSVHPRPRLAEPTGRSPAQRVSDSTTDQPLVLSARHCQSSSALNETTSHPPTQDTTSLVTPSKQLTVPFRTPAPRFRPISAFNPPTVPAHAPVGPASCSGGYQGQVGQYSSDHAEEEDPPSARPFQRSMDPPKHISQEPNCPHLVNHYREGSSPQPTPKTFRPPTIRVAEFSKRTADSARVKAQAARVRRQRLGLDDSRSDFGVEEDELFRDVREEMPLSKLGKGNSYQVRKTVLCDS